MMRSEFNPGGKIEHHDSQHLVCYKPDCYQLTLVFVGISFHSTYKDEVRYVRWYRQQSKLFTKMCMWSYGTYLKNAYLYPAKKELYS